MRSVVARVRRIFVAGGRLIVRGIRDESGQDLVEYGLLAAFIGVAGWAVLQIIPDTIGSTYASWLDTDNGVPSVWDPPEPSGGGS